MKRGENLKHVVKHVDGRCYARANAVEKLDIRESEFVYITESVMKVAGEALTVQAARLVLFHGRTQKQACDDTGCRAAGLSTCLTRIREHHQRIMSAFGARMLSVETVTLAAG